MGLAAFIVGIILVGIYLWSALKEGYWSRSSKQPVPEDVLPLEAPSSNTQLSDTVFSALARSTAQSTVIEDTLDDLLDSKITRDEAAARIRLLMKEFGE